jgi:hypothetical protein
MGRPATLRVDIATNADTRGIDRAEGRLGRFGSGAKKVGKVAAVGLAAVGVAAIGAAKVSVDAASRQQQAYGALDSIYGKSAKRVKAWAATAADSVGLARSEYAELSSVVGAQLTGMGFATDKAAGKSRDLIKTGADLAATFGGSVSDAVSAVSSVLKGETDPIERYGVSIKAADVSARLAAMGLDGLTGKAAKQAKAQATLALLTEQTTKTQGAFARESNTLAGQQERLKAKFENVKATIGSALLPILTRLFTWVNERLLPGAKRLGGELAQRFGPAVSRVGEWISTRLIPTLRSLVGWFMERVYPSLKAAVIPILNGVRSAFGSVRDAIERNKEPLSSLVRFLGRVIEASGPVRHMVGVLLGAAFRGAGKFIGAMVDGIGFLIGGLGRLGSYLDWIMDKLRALASGPTKILSKLGALFSAEAPHRMTPRLVSWAPGVTAPGSSFTTAGLATGALGIDTLGDLAPTRASYTDARDLSVTIRVEGGALTDPSIVDKIQRALDQRQRQLGRAPAFGAV